jgi:hypothetical protein
LAYVDNRETQLIVCGNPECRLGIAVVKDPDGGPPRIFPGALTGEPFPNALSVDVDRAWTEARTCYSVGAFTATEMMCRKILMHLAVEATEATSDLTFAQYVSALDDAGYIAPGLKAVVDVVRQRGNAANHDLPAQARPRQT